MNRYITNLKLKTCHICNSTFNGTRHRKTCSPECTRKSKLNGMVKVFHRKFCKDCNILISEKIKFGSLAKEINNNNKRCKKCSDINRHNWYINRNKIKSEANKKSNGKKMETLKHRMKINNPMFKSETRLKVKKTLDEKIKSGIIKYKTGPEHHLWKGNRQNNSVIRTRLKNWKKSVLEKFDYKCYHCESNINLEIHHIEPLRNIIKKFTDKPLKEYNQDSKEFENLIFILINYHFNSNIGVCLCDKCHSQVDKFRKQTFINEN